MLAITDNANPLPVQGFPRRKVLLVPKLDAVVTILQDLLGFVAIETSLHRSRQLRQVVLESRDHGQANLGSSMQKRAGGVFGIDDQVIGETRTQGGRDSPEEARPGGMLAILRSIGLYIERQR